MKFDQQLAAWALDRAIETLKIGRKDETVAPEFVIEVAEIYTDWVTQGAAEPEQEKTDAEISSEKELEKHMQAAND